MNKRKRLAILLLITFIITIAFILYNYNNDSISITIEYKEKTLNEIAKISQQVAIIRGLNITKNIDVKFVNKEWAIRNWAPKSTDIPEELKLRELFYKATFLIDWNQSIVNLSQEWVGLFVAASAGYTLYINIDYFNPESSYSKNVLAHELTHIIQYEHFNVNWPLCTDARNALAALVEGDAGLVQRFYCTITKECEPSDPWSIDYNNLYLSFNAFPYIYGEKFVYYLYEVGGWELVNVAYNKPPISTYMIMFPEKYLEYLYSNNTYTPCINKDNENYTDTMGAYYIYLILSKIENPDLAFSVIKNWKKDAVTINKRNDIIYISWIIIFEEESSTQAFYKAINNNIASRTGLTYSDYSVNTSYLMNINNFTLKYRIYYINPTTISLTIEVTQKN